MRIKLANTQSTHKGTLYTQSIQVLVSIFLVIRLRGETPDTKKPRKLQWMAKKCQRYVSSPEGKIQSKTAAARTVSLDIPLHTKATKRRWGRRGRGVMIPKTI